MCRKLTLPAVKRELLHRQEFVLPLYGRQQPSTSAAWGLMARGYIDPSHPNPLGPNDASIIIYGYTPALALAVVGAVTFGISTLLHLAQLLKYRTWYFAIIILGAAMEVVGYIFRALSSQVDPYSIIYFVVQYFFIVCAPVFFSAAIYVCLSRFINKAGRQYAPLPPKVIVIVFVVVDIITTGIQVAGAALIGTAESHGKDPSTANNILLAGLAIQVFSFAVFFALLCACIWRARRQKDRTTWARSSHAQLLLLALVITSLLIELRTIFRLIETAQGVFGYLSSHEVFFGCLEYLPVVLAVTTWNFLHPGYLAPKDGTGPGTGSELSSTAPLRTAGAQEKV